MKMSANKYRLNDLYVSRLRPRKRAYLVWDLVQYGLAVQVQPTEHKAFKVIYSRAGRSRWYHLANAAAIDVAAARKLAGKIMVLLPSASIIREISPLSLGKRRINSSTSDGWITDMATGRVKYFDSERGFGFVKDDATRQDVFIHIKHCLDAVSKGDHVSFDIVSAQRGPRGDNVKRLYDIDDDDVVEVINGNDSRGAS
jgi:CspA family cold shock protein